MKLTHYDHGIELSNTPKTIIGIICAILFPVIYVSTAYSVLKTGFTDIGLFEVTTLIIVLPGYIFWLCNEFRTTVLRQKIIIDANGIVEKRLLGKDKLILWDELEEYLCESAIAPYRTNERFFKIVFYATNHNVRIQTWSFPASKQHKFRDIILRTCDKHFVEHSKDE